MTDTVKNLKDQNLESSPRKKLPISGGTAVFLIFNFLLIAGFCKFSFYVLKNHRSFIERDSLIKTYVDVQPYASKSKAAASSLAFNVQNDEAPAPFFAKTEKTTKTAFNETAPLPLPDQSAVSELPRVAKPVSRPPVIRPSVQATSTVQNRRPPVIIKNKEENDAPAIPLDTLMASGLNLLNESEKTIVASEILLQEEILPEQRKAVEEPKVSEELPVIKDNLPATIKKEVAGKKSDKRETRWVDVAELRRQLNAAEPVASKQEEINKQNAALLNMNDARQVAAVETNIVSDAAPENETGNKSSSEPMKNDGQVSVSRNLTQSVSSENAAASVTVLTAEKDDQTVSPIKTAVVQDIPFAGTAQTPETPQKVDSPAVSAEHIALAGNSPSLWKVAKIKGKSQKNAPAAKTEPKEKEKASENISSSDETAQIASSDVIYRNGKPVPIQETKSLNWMDRQEAAVWTSMSQSDAPSVWSSAAETDTASPDKAKAFRVADEQPAENVVNSSPVRVIGEESQPETKSKPLLLPLGNSSNTSGRVPANVFQALPDSVDPSTAFAPEAPASGEQPAEGQKPQGQQDGLMNKLFSFFGKNDAPDSLPSIGSPDSAPANKEASGNAKETGVSSFPKLQKPAAKQTFDLSKKSKEKEIVPTELRLTFKPNSAEMSAQSIKWIKAFGQKAKKDIQNAVEVRMSTTDPVLQSKRFAMIRNTLIGTGLEDVQIIPVATDRTPHTIVLRMIVLPEEGYAEYTTEKNGVKERLYYRQW